MKQKGNFNQAPILKNKGAKDKELFYQIPQQLADILFEELARQPAALRLMIVLCGTKPSFSLTEKWVLEHTKMTHATYSATKKALVEKGWLIIGDKKITIDYDAIYGRVTVDVLPGTEGLYIEENQMKKEGEVVPHLLDAVPFLHNRGITKETFHKIADFYGAKRGKYPLDGDYFDWEDNLDIYDNKKVVAKLKYQK